MAKDRDDDKSGGKGGDKDRDRGDKGRDSGGRHGREDNTADADRRRRIPDRADPNKHDR